MKKFGFLATVVLMMTACNNSAEIQVKVDSLGKKLDTIAKNTWDSTKKGVKNLKDKMDEKIDKLNKKDSSGKKN